jgi:phosphoglycolate phosphatase
MDMRTIIFDFDGTIGDSFKVAVEIAHEMTHRSQLVMPEEVVRLRKLRMIEVARELELPKRRWPFLLIRGRKLMTKRLAEVQPFPGMADVLATLHKQGYQLFILSSNSEKNIGRFLQDHALNRYFVRTYSGVGLLGKSRALRHILKQNHLQATDAIYVGDEARDIEGSKRVGMDCVAVGWGYNAPELLAAHAPRAVVVTPEALLESLEAWSTI